MISPSELPAWLRAGLTPSQAAGAVPATSAAIRATATYDGCVAALAAEFVARRRPRAWVVAMMIGRLNKLRNELHAAELAHLKTWVFRA